MGAWWGAAFPPGLFTYAFMVNAWLAGTAIAIAAALVGFFVVLRGQSFMAHAIPQSAFAGAAAAVLLGLNPLAGMAVGSGAIALGIALLGRGRGEGIATAMVLVLGLGMGNLFLTMAGVYAPEVFGLLFGQLVGISAAEVREIAVLALVLLGAFAFAARPLLFASAMPQTAAARGRSPAAMRIVFALLVALTATLTVPVVGALLAFSLMVAPAAAAAQVARSPAAAMAAGVAIALLSVWMSIVIAYDTNLPIGFVVSAVCALGYVTARTWRRMRDRRPGALAGAAAAGA